MTKLDKIFLRRKPTKNSNANFDTIENDEAEKALQLFFAEESKRTSENLSTYISSKNNNIDVENIITTSNNNSIENLLRHERDIFISTDKTFLIFLNNFVKTQNDKEQQKTILKEQFFYIVMLGFLALLLTPMILIISLKSLSQITAIVSLVSILFELVSAIIILPKIIAEYLFNKQEDEKLLQIIESMQKYNQDKHNYISK